MRTSDMEIEEPISAAEILPDDIPVVEKIFRLGCRLRRQISDLPIPKIFH